MLKRVLAAAGVVSLLFLGGLLVHQFVFTPKAQSIPRPRAAQSAPPETQAPEAARATVAEVQGTVEREVGDDQWEPVAIGDELEVGQALRTRRHSQASLALGTIAVARVEEESQFRVFEVSEHSRVRLDDGRFSAKVTDDKAVLKVEVQDSDAVARSQGRTEMMVLKSEFGQVTVATKDGQVQLTAAERTVDIRAGEQSTVEPQQPPSAPQPIPSSLFLKLNPLPKTVFGRNKRRFSVSGQTSPGAAIRVNGRPARVDPEGRWQTKVGVRGHGRRPIEVRAMDVTGRKKVTRDYVRRDTKTRVGARVGAWGTSE